MRLPRDGLEYANIEFSEIPYGATVEASIDRETWTPVDVLNNTAKYLLRGPDNPSTAGTLVTHNPTYVWIRLSDTPEQVVRNAGTVSIY